jgi:hypothetical protein
MLLLFALTGSSRLLLALVLIPPSASFRFVEPPG